jgi:hypothetical protein
MQAVLRMVGSCRLTGRLGGRSNASGWLFSNSVEEQVDRIVSADWLSKDRRRECRRDDD